MTLVTIFVLVLHALVDMAPWWVAYSTGYGPRYCTLLCIQHGAFVAVTEMHRARDIKCLCNLPYFINIGASLSATPHSGVECGAEVSVWLCMYVCMYVIYIVQ